MVNVGWDSLSNHLENISYSPRPGFICGTTSGGQQSAELDTGRDSHVVSICNMLTQFSKELYRRLKIQRRQVDIAFYTWKLLNDTGIVANVMNDNHTGVRRVVNDLI